jgi:hypothetical protein
MTPKPGRLFRAICLVMRCDPDIMAEAPVRDRAALVGEAAFLAVVAVIAGIAWTNFWLLFVRLPAALLFGGLAATFMPLMDVAIGAADGRLEGILRRPDARRRRGRGKIGLRLGVSLVLSQATSEGATLVICHQAVVQQEERHVQEQNRATDKLFAGKEQDLRQQRFGTLLDEKKQLEQLMANTTGPLDQALETQATAQNRVKVAQDKADMELHGAPGFPKGPGPRYKKALADEEAAQAELIKANSQVAIYQPRVIQAKNRLVTIAGKLANAEAAIRADIDALEQEKRSQMVVVRSDPLLDTVALQEVFRDPEIGWAAWKFSWLMNGVLLILELSYLMVRIGFPHASVYTVLLNKDTLIRAERAEFEYRRERAALRSRIGAPPVLPPVKLISWDGNRETVG